MEQQDDYGIRESLAARFEYAVCTILRWLRGEPPAVHLRTYLILGILEAALVALVGWSLGL